MSRRARLASLDLNLLVVLDELLRSQSTVVAAKRLGRAQSSVSHALGRLREVFGDPLFVRTGTALRPTSFAEELAAPLRAQLDALEQLLEPTAGVEPSRLERTFTLSAPDWAVVLMLPPLMARLRREAPGVDIVLRSFRMDVDRAVQSGEIDVALGVRFQPLSGLVMQRLLEEPFVCIAHRDHPDLGEPITLDAYAAAAHVLVAPYELPGSPLDDELARLGHRRRVVLRVPHFSAALFVVAQTDLIATLPSSFVHATAPLLRLRVIEPPLAIPPFSFSCLFSATRQKDPAHVWLRRCISEICREIHAGTPRAAVGRPIDTIDR
ncbi:LysR family transcriptional regulator [Sorangium sp. So ce394]|uniref:LysR family transcriptional regulator n=1 Tax=Sorangium sp. So ce394 TaxID=3133310 RepID=UPI003F5ADE07